MNKAYLIAIGKSVRTIRTPALLVGANRMRSVIVYPLCIGPISSWTIKGNNPLKGEKKNKNEKESRKRKNGREKKAEFC